MTFRALIESTEKQIKDLEKVLGKASQGVSKTEAMFKFKDGSYLKLDTDLADKRIHWFDKSANLIGTYTTAKQALKALDQSGVINEASPVEVDEIPQKIMVELDKLLKIVGNAKINTNDVHDGIHGIITGVEFKQGMGVDNLRLDTDDLKAILKLKGLRWIDIADGYITIGWAHA